VRTGGTWSAAIAGDAAPLAALPPSAANFAIHEHKFPQAIHLIFQSYSPYVRVRSPFTDYALFDFFERLPRSVRRSLYETWLAHDYPACFGSIPDQRTGLPIGAPPALVALERARRGGMRAVPKALRTVSLPEIGRASCRERV